MTLRTTLVALAATSLFATGAIAAETETPKRAFNTLTPPERQAFSACVVKTAPTLPTERVLETFKGSLEQNPALAQLAQQPEIAPALFVATRYSLAQVDCAAPLNVQEDTLPPVAIRISVPEAQQPQPTRKAPEFI